MDKTLFSGLIDVDKDVNTYVYTTDGDSFYDIVELFSKEVKVPSAATTIEAAIDKVNEEDATSLMTVVKVTKGSSTPAIYTETAKALSVKKSARIERESGDVDFLVTKLTSSETFKTVFNVESYGEETNGVIHFSLKGVKFDIQSGYMVKSDDGKTTKEEYAPVGVSLVTLSSGDKNIISLINVDISHSYASVAGYDFTSVTLKTPLI